MNSSDRIILEGRISPDKIKTYLMLPFDVPDNCTRITVSYEYSSSIGSDPHLTGGNTIDIGIFDPRGAQFLGDGFRGWSGSARNEFMLSATDATPGYLPGPLQQGTWHICLGIYKVLETGCDYRISIDLFTSEKSTIVAFPKCLELSDTARDEGRNEGGWYKGELHCHSWHSDGDSDPLYVVNRAQELGLDFLAITDHNVLSQQIPLGDIDSSLMLIPGMEVTTYQGHWNIWGMTNWIDFRINSEDEMQMAINSALEQGYLISCNHPRRFGPEWVYTDVVGFNCIEVWNGPWKLFNDDSLNYWEEKLRAGERYTAVGGSDCHFHNRDHHAHLGHPTTYVYMDDEPSPKSVLDALRAGHAFITESPTGPQIFLEADDLMMGDTVTTTDNILTLLVSTHGAQDMQLEICGATGILHQCSIPASEWETELEVDIGQTSYVRAQLVSHTADNRQVHALTNPIYINSTF